MKKLFLKGKLSEKGATLIEFAIVSGLIIFSLLITIYIFILISFTNGVSHRLQLGIKIAQSDPGDIPDIYNAQLNSTAYLGQFVPFRDDLLEKIQESDVSMLGRLVYEFREVAHFDELVDGSDEVRNTHTCLLLPGGACKVYKPSGQSSDGHGTYNWYVHPYICPIDTAIPCTLASGARRRVSGESLVELLASYPAVNVTGCI